MYCADAFTYEQRLQDIARRRLCGGNPLSRSVCFSSLRFVGDVEPCRGCNACSSIRQNSEKETRLWLQQRGFIALVQACYRVLRYPYSMRTPLFFVGGGFKQFMDMFPTVLKRSLGDRTACRIGSQPDSRLQPVFEALETFLGVNATPAQAATLARVLESVKAVDRRRGVVAPPTALVVDGVNRGRIRGPI